jgi:hypothetical protein
MDQYLRYRWVVFDYLIELLRSFLLDQGTAVLGFESTARNQVNKQLLLISFNLYIHFDSSLVHLGF